MPNRRNKKSKEDKELDARVRAYRKWLKENNYHDSDRNSDFFFALTETRQFAKKKKVSEAVLDEVYKKALIEAQLQLASHPEGYYDDEMDDYELYNTIADSLAEQMGDDDFEYDDEYEDDDDDDDDEYEDDDDDDDYEDDDDDEFEDWEEERDETIRNVVRETGKIKNEELIEYIVQLANMAADDDYRANHGLYKGANLNPGDPGFKPIDPNDQGFESGWINLDDVKKNKHYRALYDETSASSSSAGSPEPIMPPSLVTPSFGGNKRPKPPGFMPRMPGQRRRR